MIQFAIVFGFVCLSLSLALNLWRLLRGPSVGDRITSLDTMVINTIALLILYGLNLGSEIFFESAMIIAMLGFVSTVAYARFMLRGNIIE